MSIFAPAPKPASRLGYHRVLAPSAGVKVSPLCLGAMNFGDSWKDFMGECNKEQTFALLDEFYRLGGNFIDTANNYQFEESEKWIGEWMTARGNRDQMVIATKYTTGFRTAHRDTEPLQSNFVGNSMKSMRVSVERSLKKLQTDYIDLLYLHWWDFTSSVEEVMHGLNNLVTSGKVLYLGVSDTPAWVVVKANDYARANGLRPFSVYQGRWNAGFRDLEREIIPMCRDQGMAIAPWAPLGAGKFKSAEARKSDAESGSARAAELSETDIKVSDALEKVANRKNTTLHAIALAYVMHKTPNVFPIIGQRKIEHLRENVEALSVSLSNEDLDEIDSASSFDVGFPMNFIYRDCYSSRNTAADVWLTKAAALIDAPPHAAPVQPRQE
ncbi:NADP-dependent oxidoreductase domain-containing protein [Aspergillus welwitschiae]|uniref:NADP-dependent oxidoreductase domain-containing protein n=1 Tax=Aspergillus welwitschiae TaxID=1341132 RepID=A0A3F3PJR9_9EURO|nr:NADP-dependent oxidoreductase domain-containing protein [Aspergillus welwitschiae]RDH27194.1 NADP-dependent oxidoreductase domain-containing protein [Aspergillus welwitschiae]